MKRLGIVVVAVLLAGCSNHVQNSCTTLEQLTATVKAAFDSGNGSQVLDYIDDRSQVPPAVIAMERKMLDSPGVKKLHVGRIESFTVAEYPPQKKLPGELNGHPFAWQYPPTHWIVIKLENPAPKTVSMTFILPAAEKDGRWWIVGIKEAPALAPQPPDPASGEFSSNDRLSIRRTSKENVINQVEVKNANVVAVDIRGETLLQILMDFDGQQRWYLGGDLLPGGRFECRIQGLPKPRGEIFELLRREYEKTFGVRITVSDVAWDAYELTPPNQLPPSIRNARDDETKHTFGNKVSRHTFAEFAEWLQGEAGRPMVVVNAPPGEYTFDVDISPFDKLTGVYDWLHERGFTIRPIKIKKPTVLIQRTEENKTPKH